MVLRDERLNKVRATNVDEMMRIAYFYQYLELAHKTSLKTAELIINLAHVQGEPAQTCINTIYRHRDYFGMNHTQAVQHTVMLTMYKTSWTLYKKKENIWYELKAINGNLN